MSKRGIHRAGVQWDVLRNTVGFDSIMEKDWEMSLFVLRQVKGGQQDGLHAWIVDVVRNDFEQREAGRRGWPDAAWNADTGRPGIPAVASHVAS